MKDHYYMNGKRACSYNAQTKTLEIASKGFKAVFQLHQDGAVTVTDYDINGNTQTTII
jgi:hypothetical protein